MIIKNAVLERLTREVEMLRGNSMKGSPPLSFVTQIIIEKLAKQKEEVARNLSNQDQA